MERRMGGDLSPPRNDSGQCGRGKRTTSNPLARKRELEDLGQGGSRDPYARTISSDLLMQLSAVSENTSTPLRACGNMSGGHQNASGETRVHALSSSDGASPVTLGSPAQSPKCRTRRRRGA